MFRRLWTDDLPTTIFFDGRAVRCRPGDSVAAALLAAGVERFRTTPVSGAARIPYCMIGNCFDCLVEIDGQADRQACLVPVAEGMQVRSQSGTGRFDTI
ncbi:(2Fe-2S)-binding protein [Mesorhizobium sp. BAC0120]|uniref:(2Fe-2S)-binding protein n=1 Tax=Mesorhizobium sp. BAC0120 TaxID=3090670 RepID=UPI00298C7AF1|nr:(2Fe-2S)-binding protein [Mesorhizobium sp. BAC0120]MDW6022641.1 (2Fe-2S)-binding protein [Mesorhizobium sp. BAC0120]